MIALLKNSRGEIATELSRWSLATLCAPYRHLRKVFKYTIKVLAIIYTFSHLSYAKFYLGSALALPIALLHYLIVGLHRDYVPPR